MIHSNKQWQFYQLYFGLMKKQCIPLINNSHTIRIQVIKKSSDSKHKPRIHSADIVRSKDKTEKIMKKKTLSDFSQNQLKTKIKANENTFQQVRMKEIQSKEFADKLYHILSKKNCIFANDVQAKRLLRYNPSLPQKFQSNISGNDVNLKQQLNNYEGFPQKQGCPLNIFQQYKKSIEIKRSQIKTADHLRKKSQLGKQALIQNPEMAFTKVIKNIENQGKNQTDTFEKNQLHKPMHSRSGFIKSNILMAETVKGINITLCEAPVYRRRISKVNLKSSSSESPIRKVIVSKTKKVMKFHQNDEDSAYNKRFKNLFDFLFKVNFTNNIYVNLQLKVQTEKNQQNSQIYKYKVYVGRGNNCLLVKSLLKRRFWIQVVDSPHQSNILFYWTQNKIDYLFQRQSSFIKQQEKPAITANGWAKSSYGKNKNKKIIEEQQEKYENNKKIILHTEKSAYIDSYIFTQGYRVPFQSSYEVNVITNHIPNNVAIGSKKRLFKSLFHYYSFIKKDPFDVIPQTYHITGKDDNEFKKFIRENLKDDEKIWIVKPGQNTNQGRGIKLAKTCDVSALIKGKSKHMNGDNLTYIVQSYLNQPFLYNGRKFDLRHYFMITSVNGILKAYWYRDGYIRTSSQRYDVEDLQNEFIHLTNDFIQKKSQNYSSYEIGNKVSYNQFQRYLDTNYPAKGYNLQRDILQKMKHVIKDVIRANYRALDHRRKQCNFQVFGFDIMIDSNFKPWLIEINYNPCLEIVSPIQNRIIPQLIECSLRLGLDPLLPPKNNFPNNKKYLLTDQYLKNLRYEIIFDEQTLESPIYICNVDLNDKEEQEQYCDDGKEIQNLQL